MPITRKTSDEFATNISKSVTQKNSTIDTNIGTYRDVFIDPFSYALENQNDRIVYVNKLLSLENADILVPEDVDSIVYNEKMVRYGQSSSTTTVKFVRAAPPTTDILIPINFPLATLQSSQSGFSVGFKTIEEKTMYAASASQYFSAETGKYEISVAVVSTSQGTNTEVGQFAISEFRRPFPEFDEVYNPEATTDGRGVETNAELAKRYGLHVIGSQISTPLGLERAVRDNFNNVEDVYTVYGDDPALERTTEDPGAVDMWVKGVSDLTRTLTTTYQGTFTLNPVDFQPLIKVIKVSSVAAGATYLEGTDFVTETGIGAYAYSNRASDGIRWIPGGSHPDIGDDLQIEYKYNSIINQLTSYFAQPEFYHLGSDNLFRWAQPLQIELDADLKVKAGSPANVLTAVKESVLLYVNSLLLGENLEEFDIDGEVSKIYGVDNWVYNQLSVKDGTGVGDIEIGPYNYSGLLESDLIINLR